MGIMKLNSRQQAANACVQVLDTEFFKALCEPVRVEIFRQLILQGRSDVGTIAAPMPQDRSVIARHLQTMERAGLLRAEVEGRHTFYDIDGPSVVERVEKMAALIRQLAPLCCAPAKR
jgi:DNA-binding transcriptional ArsR family regulator